MSIVHIAFYPSDWLAGTRGLSAEETGVYITLVCRMYEMAGPIERDDDRLHRLCGAKSKKAFVKSLEYLISEGKIIESDGELFNERAQKEIEITTNKSSKAKTAAQSRWNRKPNKNNDRTNADASPKHMPEGCQSEPEPEPDKRDTNVSPKTPDKQRLPEGWTPTDDDREYALSLHLNDNDIQEIADDFHAYWTDRTDAGGRKSERGWRQTWRNRCRDVAPRFIRNRQMAGGKVTGGYGQGGSIASIAARRHAGG